jgi:hypothetical protein
MTLAGACDGRSPKVEWWDCNPGPGRRSGSSWPKTEVTDQITRDPALKHAFRGNFNLLDTAASCQGWYNRSLATREVIGTFVGLRSIKINQGIMMLYHESRTNLGPRCLIPWPITSVGRTVLLALAIAKEKFTP